jgi:hypothetical protein
VESAICVALELGFSKAILIFTSFILCSESICAKETSPNKISKKVKPNRYILKNINLN